MILPSPKTTMLLLAVMAVTSSFIIPTASGQDSSGERQGFSFARQFSSMFSYFTNLIPTRESIRTRMENAFSRSSLNQAMSVLSPIPRDSPYPCSTTDDDMFQEGLCVRIADCMYYEGTSYGSCGAGFGSCCVYHRGCTQTSRAKTTQFINPGYPKPSDGQDECKLTIKPMSNNICQYRIDFDKFSVKGPNHNSNCVTDFLGILGGPTMPKICGDMTGQHLYIDVKPGHSYLELTMDADKTESFSRIWNIKITQIPCNSPEKVPDGCMQFYNETFGTVRSLNFRNQEPDDKGTTRQIHNQRYGVCVNSKVGYCKLTWTAATFDENTDEYLSRGLSFSVTGNTSDPDTEPMYGVEKCNSDYVVIPGGEFLEPNKVLKKEDRFCGTTFPRKVTTQSQPYRLYVNTDKSEEGDYGNTGFALHYRHNHC